MAKHSTADLEGALLDAAVARAQGWEIEIADGCEWWWSTPAGRRGNPSDAEARVQDSPCSPLSCPAYSPSRLWSDGGPIIERERIDLRYTDDGYWNAGIWVGSEAIGTDGPTPLTAAMRAYVASKFGEEVELP